MSATSNSGPKIPEIYLRDLTVSLVGTLDKLIRLTHRSAWPLTQHRETLAEIFIALDSDRNLFLEQFGDLLEAHARDIQQHNDARSLIAQERTPGDNLGAKLEEAARKDLTKETNPEEPDKNYPVTSTKSRLA